MPSDPLKVGDRVRVKHSYIRNPLREEMDGEVKLGPDSFGNFHVLLDAGGLIISWRGWLTCIDPQPEPTGPRYVVTPPIPEGNQWWYVVDTESDLMPNFQVASFFAGMPNAGREAAGLCGRLNADVHG